MARTFHNRNNQASDHENTAGFTLVEMLVALTLVAIISLMASTFLGNLKNWHTRLVNNRQPVELVASARYIANTLEGALLLPVDFGDNRQALYLRGSPTSVRFVVHGRFGISESLLRTVSISLEPAGDNFAVSQTITTRRFGDAGRQSRKIIEIVSNVDGIAFEYLGVDASGRHVWSKEWNTERSLPLAVKIHLAATRGHRSYSVESAARLLLAASPSAKW